jgi:hypothetical protein
MLKDQKYNLVNYLFFGVLVVYLFNKPPNIIIKYPSIDSNNVEKFINLP